MDSLYWANLLVAELEGRFEETKAECAELHYSGEWAEEERAVVRLGEIQVALKIAREALEEEKA